MGLIILTYRAGEVLPELPGTHFYHSNAFFRLCESSKSLAPILVVAKQDDCVVGKCVAVLIRVRHGFPKSWFSVCQLVEEPEFFVSKEEELDVFQAMLNEIVEMFSSKCFFIEIRNVWRKSLFGYKALREYGFFPVDKIFAQNNFKKPRSVWKQLDETKRRQANKGISQGTEITEVSCLKEMDEWYSIAHKIYSPRLIRHLPPLQFYHKFYQEVVEKGWGAAFLARYKNKIIGGMLCVFSKDVMYEWYIGSANDNYRKQYPGVLLSLYALNYCQEHGYRFFNFKGSVPFFHPSGILDFKLQFGGKPRNVKRWYRFKWCWLNKIFSKLYV